MNNWDFMQSQFNVFGLNTNNKITISGITNALKSVNNFSDFFKSTSKASEITKYSFVIAGELVKSDLKITQLHKFYSYVKNMQYEVEENLNSVLIKFKLLLPKLAGASSKKTEIKPLYDIITTCIQKDNIKTKLDVKYFIEFFEAILNYFEVLSGEKKERKQH